MSRCQHMNFKVQANVVRLTDTDDGIVTGFTTTIKVNCSDCDMPFEWMGVKGGFSPLQPMRSADGLALRAPIYPVEEL